MLVAVATWQIESRPVQSDWRKRDTRLAQSGCRSFVFDAFEADYFYIHQGRQGCSMATIGIPMGTNSTPFLANLYCFTHELAFLRSLVHPPQARTPWPSECRLIWGMHEASRHIDDLLTFNFPQFKQVMYRRMDETDPPLGSRIILSGIYPRGFHQLEVNRDGDLQASQARAQPSS